MIPYREPGRSNFYKRILLILVENDKNHGRRVVESAHITAIVVLIKIQIKLKIIVTGMENLINSLFSRLVFPI